MLTASATILAAVLGLIVPTALVIAVILLSDDEPADADADRQGTPHRRAPMDPNDAARTVGSWG